jgi:hypothetical protein
MRLPGVVDGIVYNAGRVGAHGLAVRSLIGLAAVGCWATATAVGHLSWLVTVLLAIACAAAVSTPDSSAPLGLIVMVTATWMVEVQPMSPGWSIVLAMSVLVIHAASARAAALGDGAALDRRVARRWLGQTAVVAGVTVALWAGLLLLDDAAVSGGLALSAVALVSVIAFGVVVARVARARRPA